MNREDIINIIKEIVNGNHSDKELDIFYNLLKINTEYPKPFDLIFWPERDYSIEEMADIMINYKREGMNRNE